jgi:uncharacterized membrane protein
MPFTGLRCERIFVTVREEMFLPVSAIIFFGFILAFIAYAFGFTKGEDRANRKAAEAREEQAKYLEKQGFDPRPHHVPTPEIQRVNKSN